jgi:HEAT repeat protein
MKKKGKLVVILTLFLALLGLAGTGWVGHTWLLEQWLLFRLEHGDASTKLEVVAKLGNLGAVEAIPAILKAASGPEKGHTLEEAAHTSLVTMGASAVPELIEALKAEDKALRTLVADVLRVLCPAGKRPVPFLVWLLAEGEREERPGAIQELANRDPLPAEAAELLTAALEDQEDRYYVPRAAEEALAHLGPKVGRAAEAFVKYVLKVKNTEAEDSLVRFGAAAVPYLIEALKDPEKENRRIAVYLLWMMGPPAAEAVPALIRALKDTDDSVRENALFALGSMGSRAKAAVPLLAGAIYTAPANQYRGILATLGRIGPPALSRLLEAMETDDLDVRVEALEALHEMGPAALGAVPRLERALEDEEPEARLAAARALLRIEGRSDAASKVILRDVRPPVRSWSSDELLKVDPDLAGLDGFLSRCIAEYGKDRDEALRWLSTLEKPAPGLKEVARVLASQIEEEPLDLPAMEALWKVNRSPESAAKVVQIFRESELESPREAALDLIAKMGPDARAAVPDLVRLLSETRNGYTSRKVLQALASIGPEAKGAVPLLQEILSKWSSKRIFAAHALLRIGDESSLVPALIEVLMNPKSKRGLFFGGDFRESAAYLLGTLGPSATEALPALKKALEAEDIRVRTRAAWAIWKVAGDAEDAVPVLISALEQGQLAWFQGEERSPTFWKPFDWRSPPTASWLAEIGAPALRAVLRCLEHHSFWVRCGAVEALGATDVKDPVVVETLISLLGSEDYGLAEKALEGLARRSLGPDELAGLLPFLLGVDPWRVERAARVLASQGPLGLPLLLEGLEEAEADPPPGFFLAFRIIGSLAEVALLERSKSGAKRTARRALHALRLLRSELKEGTDGAEELREGAMQTLVERLRDEDPRVRQASARTLGALGDRGRRAVPFLATLLMDPDREVRCSAARVLGKVGKNDLAAVEALAGALADPRLGIAEVAARSLVSTGNSLEASLPRLIEALNHSETRIAAAMALKALGSKAVSAACPLLALLQVEGYDTRKAVQDALKAMGPGISSTVVSELSKGYNAWQLCELVATLGPSCRDAAPFLMKRVNRLEVKILQALAALGPLPAEILEELQTYVRNRPLLGLEELLAARRAIRTGSAP